MRGKLDDQADLPMSAIPPDIRERVTEFAVEITNATLAEDTPLADSLYQHLFDYHQAQLAANGCHPFITETLADYTDDTTLAVQYYLQALAQSNTMNTDEPTHTILIGIATRLIELGKMEQAEAYLRDARIEAVRRGDSYFIKEADELLQEIRS